MLRYLGYAAWFLGSLVLGLYLTFPWDVVKDRVLDQANQATGLFITAESLEPSWITGIEAKKVKIVFSSDGLGDPPPPLELDGLEARIKLLEVITGGIGVTLSAPIALGSLDVDVSVTDEIIDLDLQLQNAQLDLLGSVTSMLGLPLSGKITLDTKLKLGKKDPKLTTGRIALATEDLKILKGGKVGLFPMPPLELGNLELEVPVKQGKANFDDVRLAGADLEVTIKGNLSPAFPASRSSMNLSLGLKPTQKLLSSDPLLKPILNNFKRYQDSGGFYGVSIVGNVRRPRIKPKKLK